MKYITLLIFVLLTHLTAEEVTISYSDKKTIEFKEGGLYFIGEKDPIDLSKISKLQFRIPNETKPRITTMFVPRFLKNLPTDLIYGSEAKHHDGDFILKSESLGDLHIEHKFVQQIEAVGYFPPHVTKDEIIEFDGIQAKIERNPRNEMIMKDNEARVCLTDGSCLIVTIQKFSTDGILVKHVAIKDSFLVKKEFLSSIEPNIYPEDR